MRALALSALSLVALAGPALAEDLGPGFAGYSAHFLAGFETPSGLLFEIGTLTGTLHFEDDSSVLQHAAMHCISSIEANGSGHCAIMTPVDGGAEEMAEPAPGAGGPNVADPALNHLWTSYECTEAAPDEVPAGSPMAHRCTFTIIEGDKAFEGATGSATLIAAPPVAYHPDGSASGYSLITSFDLTLPQ